MRLIKKYWLHLFIFSLFMVIIFANLWAYWQTQDKIDNLADASCYYGRVVYDFGD